MSLSAVDAIRRYVFGFVNSHDFAVCRELMSEDYLLHMGDSEVVGREAAYIPAVQHQIDQFPDMGMTVHDVITDGEHVVLHFSEHGRTCDGAVAAWPGVSIYRFDGTHLVECWVEQDHYSRRQQLAERKPIPLLQASTAPFSGHRAELSVEAESAVRRWLNDISLWPPAGVEPDPGPHSRPSVKLDRAEVYPNIVVAANHRVAFHATVWGDYRGSLHDVESPRRMRVPLHISAIASIHGAHIEIDFMATNRIALLRRLKTARLGGATQPAYRRDRGVAPGGESHRRRTRVKPATIAGESMGAITARQGLVQGLSGKDGLDEPIWPETDG